MPYAELDDWNVRLAEFTAEAVGTAEARAAADQTRAQATESYAAHGKAAASAPFSPPAELKNLFREVVRQIHLDDAWDEANRLLRTSLMSEANLAYKRGDMEALRRILEEYRNSPEAVRGDSTAADLKRILRQIARIARRLDLIED